MQRAAAAEQDTATDPVPAAPATVAVQDGDTFDGIARTLQAPGGRPAFYELNHDTIGDGPGRILTGQALRLPRRPDRLSS